MNTIGRFLNSKYNAYLLGLFYIIAGVNHFLHPEFYYGLIPDYLPLHGEINILSGLAELGLGVSVFNRNTRKVASVFIILMLILFIPSHIYFIQIGSCVNNGLCVPEWIAWVRLIIIHPLLIYWAYTVKKIY